MEKKLKEPLIPLDRLEAAADCLRTLAHPHRLRMLQMLLADEFTVGELAEACGIPSHMASEHLIKMRDRGQLMVERRGRNSYYRVSQKGLANIMKCVRTLCGQKEG